MMTVTNSDRAEWARNAVNLFGVETYCGRSFDNDLAQYKPGEDTTDSGAYTMIQDLIGDLLHLTVATGWDPVGLLRKAKSSFDYENSPGYEGD